MVFLHLQILLNKIDLEISSEEKNNYLVDIKSGGTSYDFIFKTS